MILEFLILGLILWLIQAGLGALAELSQESVTALLSVSDDTVTMTYSDGEVESVRWDELSAVDIMTTDEGPWAPDVYYILKDAKGNGCSVPLEFATEKGLVDRVSALPGFDHAASLEAMGSTDWAMFHCWRKSPTL